MSAIKRYAEDISVEMGFDGELNDEVLREGQRRLDLTSRNKWMNGVHRVIAALTIGAFAAVVSKLVWIARS